MDKQKQIEEMARDFGDKKGYDCRVITDCCKECILRCDCMPYSYAEGAYNAGYRKIPENAVVLTREQYEKDLAIERELGERKASRARKETAEKFAERVKMAFYYEFDELIPSIMADKIDEICKEITEGKANASKTKL